VCGDRREVKAFLARPIEGDWPYLWIDATYVKVRQNGRIVSVAVIVALGQQCDPSWRAWQRDRPCTNGGEQALASRTRVLFRQWRHAGDARPAGVSSPSTY
jgi:hypothetical protein